MNLLMTNSEMSNDPIVIFCFFWFGIFFVFLGTAIASFLDSHFYVDEMFKKIWFGSIFCIGIIVIAFGFVDLIFNP